MLLAERLEAIERLLAPEQPTLTIAVNAPIRDVERPLIVGRMEKRLVVESAGAEILLRQLRLKDHREHEIVEVVADLAVADVLLLRREQGTNAPLTLRHEMA